MHKLQNNTLQKFLDDFVNELKRENNDREYHETRELNIPFILSTLCQSFVNDIHKYDEFITDLEKWSDYTIIIDKPIDDYNGIIDVNIRLVKYKNGERDYYNYVVPDHNYQLSFFYESRDWGFCECTPDMPDYREDKHCCGHGCDATFCGFTLSKIIRITSEIWNGDEHDYWDFEDAFYACDKELADKKMEEDKANMIKELKSRIEADRKKLAELEGE